MKDFLRSVEMLNVSSSLRSVLENLSLLLVVNLMMEQSGQFLQVYVYLIHIYVNLSLTNTSLTVINGGTFIPDDVTKNKRALLWKYMEKYKIVIL